MHTVPQPTDLLHRPQHPKTMAGQFPTVVAPALALPFLLSVPTLLLGLSGVASQSSTSPRSWSPGADLVTPNQPRCLTKKEKKSSL